jgi:signal transduction histidine kinase
LLSNLIGNAMKFTPSGGGVTIKIRAEAQTVRYQVSDTGIGIPREELPRVFDRYWTSNASDSGGVGLGLYITKGIVEAHGGQIWVESKAGAGSCFTFELPAPLQARTSGEPRAAPLA